MLLKYMIIVALLRGMIALGTLVAADGRHER
jgi:hypothetical protein